MLTVRKKIVDLVRKIADTKDKELIKEEKATLRFKALSIDKIFTDVTRHLGEFIEITSSINTFQEKEIKMIKDVIMLIKKYHVALLSEVELAQYSLTEYIKRKRGK